MFRKSIYLLWSIIIALELLLPTHPVGASAISGANFTETEIPLQQTSQSGLPISDIPDWAYPILVFSALVFLFVKNYRPLGLAGLIVTLLFVFVTSYTPVSAEDLPRQAYFLGSEEFAFEKASTPPAESTPPEEYPPYTAEGCSLSPNVPYAIRQYCSSIDKWAYARNLDPRLVAAIIQQECPSGDNSCYSRDGAACLMQVMPSDGLSAIKFPQYFNDRPKTAELQADPDFCIKTGTGILRDYIDYWGSTYEGIAHYGPTRKSMLSEFGDSEYYVKKVLGHYEKFK